MGWNKFPSGHSGGEVRGSPPPPPPLAIGAKSNFKSLALIARTDFWWKAAETVGTISFLTKQKMKWDAGGGVYYYVVPTGWGGKKNLDVSLRVQYGSKVSVNITHSVASRYKTEMYHIECFLTKQKSNV